MMKHPRQQKKIKAKGIMTNMLSRLSPIQNWISNHSLGTGINTTSSPRISFKFILREHTQSPLSTGLLYGLPALILVLRATSHHAPILSSSYVCDTVLARFEVRERSLSQLSDTPSDATELSLSSQASDRNRRAALSRKQRRYVCHLLLIAIHSSIKSTTWELLKNLDIPMSMYLFHLM